MATAQALRAKAVAQGTLKDSKEQKITTEAQNNTTIIKIEPVNPEVVYVPTYNPRSCTAHGLTRRIHRITGIHQAMPIPMGARCLASPRAPSLACAESGVYRRLVVHRVAMSRGAKPFRLVSPDQFRAAQPDCRWFPRASTRARPRTRSTGRDAETLR